MQRIFHTPEGVRDIYDEECRRKQELQRRMRTVFHRFGFQDIETPGFEYFEVFSNEVGTIPSKDLYKFFDREGNTLVLRPDFTPSVTRACATYFSPEEEPVSLCYTGNTYINNSSYSGKLKESTQMGVERIGDPTPEADAELLAMTVECLLSAGLKDFQISVGHVGYFKSLLALADLPSEEEKRLRELISQRNDFGVEELMEELKIRSDLAEAFVRLPQMFGSLEVLEEARALARSHQARRAVERLFDIYHLMTVYGYEKYISFDFAMVSKYQYYTGIIFHAYTYGTGEPVVKGGRYDELMQHFGKPAASIGFAIVIDNLLLALQSQKITFSLSEKPYVLTYTQDKREAAIREAGKLRSEGKNVLLRQER